MTTDSLSPTSFRLRESGRGNGIETFDILYKVRESITFTRTIVVLKPELVKA